MPFSGIVQENGKWVGKGYAFYIFDLLSLKLNFTYTIVPPTRHILGNKNSGVLSLLYNKVFVENLYYDTMMKVAQ